ncbi:MAG: tetratricopeptide repeat protein [Fulvivirga sp.]
MIKLKHHITLIFSILICVGSFSTAFSQKNRKKNNQESKIREAEFYFTEGEKYYILEDYAKALLLFQKSLDTNPDNATVYYKIAQIHSQGDNVSKALQNINLALSLEKDNKYFYVLAADINTQLGDFEKASELLEEMTSRLDNTDQYLFELAALYLYQKRYDDALSTYDKIEKVYGISEEVVSQKQKIHLQNNNVELALAEGKKLMANFPENEGFVLKQAEILFANNRSGEALVFLKEYLVNNESASIRLLLADLQRQQGNIDDALNNLEVAFDDPTLDVNNKIQLLAELRNEFSLEELKDVSIKLSEKLIRTHPDVADTYAVYGDILYALGRKSEAQRAYQQALAIDESNFALWQNTLQIFSELNKPDSVIAISEQALEIFPNQGAIYYFNGSANLQKRNYEEAVFALERGKRLSTANLGLVGAFNSMLGEAYNGTKQYDKSDKAFEAALEYDPNNYGLLNNYSYYLALRQDHLEKAEQMAEKAVKNNPDNNTFIDTYAWVLFMREKYKEAKKVMEKAINSGNVSAIHYEHYGDILYKLGNVDLAVEQWQKAKGLNPNRELIDKKIADRKLYEQ